MDRNVCLQPLIGVLFLVGDRDPDIGLNCWGLFMFVQRAFGHEVPDVGVLCTEILAINKKTKTAIAERWKKVDAPAPGVAAIMATHPSHSEILQHFGVFLDERHIIHCLPETGVVISNLEHMQWVFGIRGFMSGWG